MRAKELRDYEQLYRKKQPVITRTLSRLEKNGLVRLTRRDRYVKKVELTLKGTRIVRELTVGESVTI